MHPALPTWVLCFPPRTEPDSFSTPVHSMNKSAAELHILYCNKAFLRSHCCSLLEFTGILKSSFPFTIFWPLNRHAAHWKPPRQWSATQPVRSSSQAHCPPLTHSKELTQIIEVDEDLLPREFKSNEVSASEQNFRKLFSFHYFTIITVHCWSS